MPPSSKAIYRILLSECKEIFLPHNREFLQATLESCSNSILTLSNGKSLLKRLPKNPKVQLRNAFRDGSEEDMQIFFSILPSLFRYTRAARLIERHLVSPARAAASISVASPLTSSNATNKGTAEDLAVGLGAGSGNAKLNSSLESGAVLISKLYYNAAELKLRDVDEVVRGGIQEQSRALRTELTLRLAEKARWEMGYFKQLGETHSPNTAEVATSTPAAVEETNFPPTHIHNANGNTNIRNSSSSSSSSAVTTASGSVQNSLHYRRRLLIIQVINALNAVILEREGIRDIGEEYEHLIDQLVEPERTYYRGMPITYASLYGAIINQSNLCIEAVGIPFPRNFLSRIVVRPGLIPVESAAAIAAAAGGRGGSADDRNFHRSISNSSHSNTPSSSTSRSGKLRTTSMKKKQKKTNEQARIANSAIPAGINPAAISKNHIDEAFAAASEEGISGADKYRSSSSRSLRYTDSELMFTGSGGAFTLLPLLASGSIQHQRPVQYNPATRRKSKKQSRQQQQAEAVRARRQQQVQQEQQRALNQVSYSQLLGEWVGFYDTGLQQVRIEYNAELLRLEAIKLDGDEFVPAGQLSWSMDLRHLLVQAEGGVAHGNNLTSDKKNIITNDDNSNQQHDDSADKKNSVHALLEEQHSTAVMLDVGEEYDVFVQFAQSGFENAQLVPYRLKISALPSDIFIPESVLARARARAADAAAAGEEDVDDVVAWQSALGSSPRSGKQHKQQQQQQQHRESDDKEEVVVDGIDLWDRSPYYEIQLEPVVRTQVVDGGDHVSASINSRQPIQRLAYTAFANNSISSMGMIRDSDSSDSSAVGGAAAAVVDVEGGGAGGAGGAVSPQEEAEIVTTAPSSAPTIHFCRTMDMDRCLLDISDRGVVPLTPVTYLAVMKRFGYGADRLPSVLEPASSEVVASRMAGNLARASMRHGGPAEEVLENSCYWTAIRRLFDYRVQQNKQQNQQQSQPQNKQQQSTAASVAAASAGGGTAVPAAADAEPSHDSSN